MKPKLLLGLFGLLVAVMLASVVLGYQGIARLRQNQYPPFLPAGMTFTGDEKIQHPNNQVILFLDSREGKFLVGFLTVAVPVVCGVLMGDRKKRLWSFAVLIVCSALFCGIGLSLYLHAIYDSLTP